MKEYIIILSYLNDSKGKVVSYKDLIDNTGLNNIEEMLLRLSANKYIEFIPSQQPIDEKGFQNKIVETTTIRIILGGEIFLDKQKNDSIQYSLLVITSIFVFVGAILEVWLPIQDKCLKFAITGLLVLGVLTIVRLISKKHQ